MKDRLNIEKEVIYVKPGDTLCAVLNMFKHFCISHVPVVEGDKLLGIISKSDITNTLLTCEIKNESVVSIMNTLTAETLMTNNVVCVRHDTSLEDLSKIFMSNEIGSVVVTFKDKIVGIITEKDMIALLSESLEYSKMKGLGIVDRLKSLVYDTDSHYIAKALSDVGV